MGVVGRIEINARLRKRLADPGSLVITPLLDKEEAFDADSVDLRLGRNFLLPKNLQKPHYCPDSQSKDTLYTEAFVPFGRYLVVPAHQTILGATLEFIKLPQDLCGEILTKSSVARTFVLIETAPWIHPGYRGCLTLEIANVSNTPVLLYPGRLIGQLILLHLDDRTQKGAKKSTRKSKSQGKLKPSYFGPIYPEGPKFNDPGTDLARIGITDTWTIVESPSKGNTNAIFSLDMASDSRQAKVEEIRHYATVRVKEILGSQKDADVVLAMIDSAVASMNFSQPLYDSASRNKSLVTGSITAPNETFGRGDLTGGTCIKPGNIRVRLRDLLRVGTPAARLLHDPSMLNLCGLVLALWELAATVRVDLTANEIIVFRVMWELSEGNRPLSFDEILKRANRDLSAQGFDVLKEVQLGSVLDRLGQLGSIKNSSATGPWVVVEEIVYEYR